MPCETCSKRGLKHEEVRLHAEASLFYFARVLCGFGDLEPELHGGILRWILKRWKNGVRRFIILLPRGSRKSTLFSIVRPLHKAFTEPDFTTAVFHESSTMSSRFLRMTQGLLGSRPMLHFFQDLIPQPRETDWNNEMLSVKRPGRTPMPSIWARGIDSSVTGGHFNEVVFDDIVGETTHRSPALVQRAIDFVTHSNPLLIDPQEGAKFVVGTWWPGGFYEWLLDSPGWHSLVLGAYVDDRYLAFLDDIGVKTEKPSGSPIYSHFTPLGLEQARLEMGEYAFSHQMLNIPISLSEQRFRMEDIESRYFTLDGEWLNTGSEKIPWKEGMLYMTCDPATGEHSKTDESAIVVTAYLPGRNWAFILDAWAGKVLADKLVSQLVMMARRWGITVAGLEAVGGFKVLKPFLPHEMARQNYYFRVEELAFGHGKKFRIAETLQPFVANRQVWFQRDQIKLIRELVNFQIVGSEIRGRSPNLVDALSFHAEKWRFYHADNQSADNVIPHDYQPTEQQEPLPDRWGICAS